MDINRYRQEFCILLIDIEFVIRVKGLFLDIFICVYSQWNLQWCLGGDICKYKFNEKYNCCFYCSVFMIDCKVFKL